LTHLTLFDPQPSARRNGADYLSKDAIGTRHCIGKIGGYAAQG